MATPEGEAVEHGRRHAQLLCEAGTDPTAVLALLLALQREHGDGPGLLSDIGAVLHACGLPDQARTFFHRALVIDPDHADARANLGALTGAGDEDRPTAEVLAPMPDGVDVANPELALHAVAANGLLGPYGRTPGDPDGPSPRLRLAVIGGESCGTRLMSRLLSRAGCEVLHRSFPYEGAHLRHWPEEAVRRYGPDAIVIMTRDWWEAVPSQVRAGHLADEGTAFANLQQAWCRTAELVRGRRWCTVAYESLVQRPQVVIGNVRSWLEIPAPQVGELFDGNERYLGPARSPANADTGTA